MDLRDYQKAMMDAIYADNSALLTHVSANERLTAAAAIEVYKGSVHSNLIAVMGDIYPVLKKLLGDEFFDAMSARFVGLTPSRSASLDDYGVDLPEFIEQFAPLHDYPYMADVARLEWAWHELFHAEDETPGDFSSLSGLTAQQQERLVFKPVKALRLLVSDYPIDCIWQANQPDNEDNTVELLPGAFSVAVFRDGLSVLVTRLSADEVAFVEACQKGMAFSDIAMAWDEARGDVQGDVQEVLVGLIEKKILLGFEA